MLFTHAGLALSANTNYVVVIKQRGTGSVELNTTTSGGEDTSLGLSDWSIKDKFYWQSGSTWMLKSGDRRGAPHHRPWLCEHGRHPHMQRSRGHADLPGLDGRIR